MSLIDFKRFLTIDGYDLVIYLENKKVMNKKLSAKTNTDLLNVITAMVLYKKSSRINWEI